MISSADVEHLELVRPSRQPAPIARIPRSEFDRPFSSTSARPLARLARLVPEDELLAS